MSQAAERDGRPPGKRLVALTPNRGAGLIAGAVMIGWGLGLASLVVLHLGLPAAALAGLALASIGVVFASTGTLRTAGRGPFIRKPRTDQPSRVDPIANELTERVMRLEAVVSNMSQGLIMFDPQERVVICNDFYIEMYGLSRKVAKPGCLLIDLLRHRVETGGQLNKSPEQYRLELLAGLARGEIVSLIVETAQGREILVKNSPVPTGGWVATHEDITDRRRAEAQIAYMAHHDALTGLLSRSRFQEELQQVLARQKPGDHLGVLFLDLDRFKEVNDALGHPIGDLLIKAMADRLRNCVRDTDLVARLGGDEFAVLQVGASQPGDATSLASRLLDAIGAPYELEGHQVVVGLSIGIALSPKDGQDSDELLRSADLALYRAKIDGRGLYRFFEPEMDARMQARRSLEIDLREAIIGGQFELFYQPILNLQSQQLTGFEALVRWQHPERGLLAPADFISVAEETGLAIPLVDWILRHACTEAAKWPGDIRIAVNVSPTQFRNKGFMSMVMSALAASGLAPDRLELEITEAVLLQDCATTLSVLQQLRELGVRVAMDDFGTGCSMLSYLRKFPFNKIKIDQSFIRDMSDGDDCLAIVRAIVAMGSGLCICTTAEGVETIEQLKRLKVEGCTEAQGYLFSPPKPAAEITAWLAAVAPTSNQRITRRRSATKNPTGPLSL
jgi:diguanylate cyclase (GGDEF)-like protein